MIEEINMVSTMVAKSQEVKHLDLLKNTIINV
jgi:hypothetical protein